MQESYLDEQLEAETAEAFGEEGEAVGEGFEEEAFAEEELDALMGEEAFLGEEGVEGEGFLEGEDVFEEGLEADAWDEGLEDTESFYEALEDAFAESMGAAREDEFIARVRGRLNVQGKLHITPLRRPGPPRPPGQRPGGTTPPIQQQPRALWARVAQQALPTAARLAQAGARSAGGALGGAIGRGLGGAVGGVFGPVGRTIGATLGGVAGGYGGRAAGGWAGQRLTQWAVPRIQRWLQSNMDSFADLAAENTFAQEDLDEFSPVLAGLAARYVVGSTLPPAARRARPQATSQLARQVMRATHQASQLLTQRYGGQALRGVPRIVAQGLRQAQQDGRGVRAVPSLILQRARRVTAQPQVARRLSAPSVAAQRVRAVAGLPAGRPLPARVSPRVPQRRSGQQFAV